MKWLEGSTDPDILREVIASTRPAFVGQLLVLFFSLVFFYGFVPVSILAAWSLLHLLNFRIRFRIVTKLLASFSTETEKRRLFRNYCVSLAWTSLLWAAMAFFNLFLPEAYHFLVYALVIALTFGATMSIGPVTPLFLLYVLPMNLSMMGMLLAEGGRIHIAAAFFLPVSLFFAGKAAKMHLMDYTVLVTGKKEATALKEYFERQATYDDLTGIVNRNRFLELFHRRLEEAERCARPLALFFIDLNRFKQINDTYGHATGDIVLEEVGKRLRETLRKEDIPARFAGDEFVVVVEGIDTAEDLAHLAQKLHDAIASPIEAEGHTLKVSPSIGIARFPDDAKTAEALLRAADEAMYCSKRQGEPFAFYR